MTDPAERFIEAAVRPLADNAEMQILAAQELRTAIDEAAEQPNGDTIAQAAENLEKGELPGWFKIGLYALTALATILAAIPVARDYQRYRFATFRLFGMSDPDIVILPGLPFKYYPESEVSKILGDFTPAEKRLLFPNRTTYPETFKALWESNPQNPAYFSEHARACGSSGISKLPAAFLKNADSLDPENGWFRCYAAGFAARDAVRDNPAKRPPGTPETPRPTHVVKDPAKLDEALTLLDQAMRMPRFDSYERELFLRRIEILPPGSDSLGRLFVEKYLEMDPLGSRWIHRYIAQAVTVKGQELARAGDSAGFLKVTALWESFVRRSLENPGLPPNDHLWALSGFPEASKELSLSARTLSLGEKAAHYQRLVDDMKAWKIATNSRTGEARDLLTHGGPDAQRLIYPIARVENPPSLTVEDLRPGKNANAAKRERLKSAGMGAIILMAILFIAGIRFCRGAHVRRLSASIVRVLRPIDHAWILIGGVILPVLVLALTEPLENSPSYRIFWPLGIMMAGLQAALLLTLPAQIVISRLNLRLAPLGRKVREEASSIQLAWGLVMAFVARFATDLSQSTPVWSAALLGLITFATLYLIIPTAALIARNSAVFWHSCCRALIPAHVLALLLMALLVPLHHARERYWTERNVLTKIEPGIPAMNRYEHEAERQVRKDLLEMLDAKP